MGLTVKELEEKAVQMRRLCMELSYRAGDEGSHVGPALSIMDIMTVLYFDVMKYQKENPGWEDRDRFILSKGHAVLGLYVPLILSGMISEEEGWTYNQSHTKLAGHPSGKGLKGIEHPAGSLGHGLSVAGGMALAGKMNKKSYRVYTLIGDGESEEGSIWEAAMFAAKYKLDNLTAVIDANGFQYGGTTAMMMDQETIEDRWKSFGWNVVSVDGNDIGQLRTAFHDHGYLEGKPTCIVAKTVKGFGFSRAQGNNDWHHAKISREDLDLALSELKWRGTHE